MSKVLTVVAKNLKLLLRSKISALIIIFGPLVVTLLVGLAFNNTTLFNLKVGVYSPAMDNMTESFIEKLRQQQFSVTTYSGQGQCVESIKQGAIHACMVFPPDIDLTAAGGNEITFYVDNSRVNIVYTIMDTISAGISSRTKEISTGLVQVLVDTLTQTDTRLTAESPNLVKLVEQNDQILKKQKEIDTKLTALDLTVDTSKFKAPEMKSTYAARLTELKTMEGNVKTSVNASKGYLGGMSGGNVSEVDDELDEIWDDVTGLGLNTTKWTTITSMVDEMSTAVSGVSTKMSAADTARGGVKDITSSVRTTLDGNLNTVMAVKSTVDSVTGSIDAIEVTDVSGIVSPISTKIEPVAAKTYISYLYPSLLTLLVMFTTVLLGSTLILNEKRSRAFFRNLICPIRGTLFVYSTYVTILVILAVQLLIVLALAQWQLKIDVLGNIVPVIILAFLAVTVFTLLGIAVGNVFSSEETAALAAVSASSIMLFLSNMILPLESMPLAIQRVARFNPFVVVEQLLREAILFKVPFSAQLSEGYFTGFISPVYLLVIYSVLLFMAILVVQNLAQRIFVFTHVLGLKRQEPKDLVAVVALGQGTIPEMLEDGQKCLAAGELERCREIYITINEAYAKLPKTEKKQFYGRIVTFHEALDRAIDEQKQKPQQAQQPEKGKKR